MATDAEQITRLENRADTLFEKTGELQGAYSHLATKEDLAELRGELKGIKAALWLIGAAIVIIEALARLGA